jgi:energy-coupling factor transporter ATP-binding protein EcfA2
VDPAVALLDLARSRPPTLGAGRLVCIDGPAGSGKTTLAAAVAALEPAARVVHMDDLYDGWGGLSRLTDQLTDLLRPLSRGATSRYRRYDWVAGRYAETVTVEPAPLLVLEGVGCGARRHADLVTALAWVETAPRPGPRRRGDAPALGAVAGRRGRGVRPRGHPPAGRRHRRHHAGHHAGDHALG